MEDNEQIITYENIIEQFLQNFPEFKEKAEERRTWWVDDMWDEEDQLTYIFFGCVLNDYLMEEGLVKMNDPQLLQRLFAFLEKMALSTDKRLHELLEAEILERIGDDKLLLTRARALMGKKTLEHSHAIEKSWGRE